MFFFFCICYYLTKEGFPLYFIMPKPEVAPGRQGQESVPHDPKRRFSQTASSPWDPGTSPPMSSKRPRTMNYTPESPPDSIQGEQSMPFPSDPVAPDPAHGEQSVPSQDDPVAPPPKRPRTMAYTPESLTDSIQGEQSVPPQDNPVVPDPPNKQGKLHSDIYLMIVDQVIDSGKQRNGEQFGWRETLLSLARTSRLLQGIVEHYIYRYPSFLQWNPSMYGNNLDQVVDRFLFGLWARPSLASLVRGLELAYFANCSNIEQLIDAVQKCPNLGHLSLHWSPRSLPESLTEQARGVARLLNSGSKKVRYFTFVKYDVERPGQVNEVSSGCSEFYEGLTSFTATAPVSDLAAILVNHHLPNLEYFRLGECLDQQPHRRNSDRLLLEASKTCPNLRTLDWGVTLFNLPSLRDACKVWGPTLHSLRVHINDPITNPISRFLPLLPHLEELSVRTLHQITLSDIEAIVHYARSTPRHLRNISLASRTHPKPTGLPRIDDVLVDLIDALHPTLESLHLEYGRAVKPKVIKHLAKAERLHYFYVETEGRPRDAVLQLLRRKCPRLKRIYFASLSSLHSFVPVSLY